MSSRRRSRVATRRSGCGSAANPYSAEVVAGAGFDWLLIDGEHAPNTVPTILAQLQAIAPYPSQPVVRVPWNDPVIVKQVLDLGAQTLLVPMVQSADEARAAVAATRYPPHGIRGVGSALARASRWNRVGDYLHRANDEMAVLVQVETRAGKPMRSMRLRGSKVWTVCSSGRRISRLISGISAIRDIRMCRRQSMARSGRSRRLARRRGF